jgi:hypothetical protein
MGREDFEHLAGGVIRRKSKRVAALFIDGVGLDRATRRLSRKVDLTRLVSGITSGLKPEVARYYTLIPYEDDARQFSFLDAVERAGLEVVVKRLPPKGVKRQVSMDVHLASDVLCFSFGKFTADAQASSSAQTQALNQPKAANSDLVAPAGLTVAPVATAEAQKVKRSVIVVCPSREVSYSIFLANSLGVETSLADFGLYGQSDGWKGVDHWVDLSTSETIWRD